MGTAAVAAGGKKQPHYIPHGGRFADVLRWALGTMERGRGGEIPGNLHDPNPRIERLIEVE